jgi:hypothetical protein
MDFEQRLQKAIQRGQRRGEQSAREAKAKALNEEEFKSLHSQYRLALSEHIESCLRRLPHHFPGFQYETIFGERGWGAACSRDDIRLGRGGQRSNDYSRLEMTVRPLSNYHVLEITAKGTIQNKEIFNRSHYDKLEDADLNKFVELIDVWTLEYAELYSSNR